MNEKLILKNDTLDLEIKSSKLDIIASGTNELTEIKDNSNNLKLNIHLKKNAILNYYRFETGGNIEINITGEESSELNLFYGIIAKEEMKIKINSKIDSNKAKTLFVIRGVTESNGSIELEITGEVIEKVKDVILDEDIKILTLNDKLSSVIPNMLIASNETNARHAVSIASVDKSYLFYLNSKGINNESATKLIKEGFLTNIINEKMKTKVKEILNK